MIDSLMINHDELLELNKTTSFLIKNILLYLICK